MANEALLEHPIGELNEVEKQFLEAARRLFEKNRSPLFKKTRSHKNILEHPLYIALTDMWLELGVRQGKAADAERGSETGSR